FDQVFADSTWVSSSINSPLWGRQRVNVILWIWQYWVRFQFREALSLSDSPPSATVSLRQFAY
ncbi:hypothetical protein J7J35_04115, partial [Candidatus Bipolaricaulota bacterium]|nr:hypothetical protein [Candidatus Bipolaricaulota bacterium]